MTEGEEAKADVQYEEEYTDMSSKHNVVVEPLYIELIFNSKLHTGDEEKTFLDNYQHFYCNFFFVQNRGTSVHLKI